MKKTIVFVRMVVLMMSVMFAVPHAERFNAQQGQMWLGGNINYLTMGVKPKGYSSDERVNMLMLSPILRFFPVNYFSFGPKLSWTGVYQDGYNTNIWGLGVEPGFVYGGDNILPYFFASPHASIVKVSYDNSGPDPETLFMLPFSAGLVLPIAESVGFQFELGFGLGFHEDVTTNTFFIGIGICGLGENVAVSVINSIGTISPFYF